MFRLLQPFARVLGLISMGLVWAPLAQGQTGPSQSSAPDYSFAVACDMRGFVGPAPAGKSYFDGACQALQEVGGGDFMVSPGDCDPPRPVRAALDQYLGTNYLWFPVAGNHETEKVSSMDWLRTWAQAGIPHLVRHGPPGTKDTTYSFDFNNSHFVMLNEYYDGKSDTVRRDDLPDVALDWLEQDLNASRQPLVWVIGHKPLRSLPDMDTGRMRHPRDSVSADTAHFDRFVRILVEHHVRAYLCGHTHSSSVARVHDVWQVDSGHARGGGDPGAPSTFIKIRIAGFRAWADVYRSNTNGLQYQLRKSLELD